MTHRPVASVVVPTFGRPGTLLRCVEALRGQSLTDLEIIVCDDGGTPAASDTLANVATSGCASSASRTAARHRPETAELPKPAGRCLPLPTMTVPLPSTG